MPTLQKLITPEQNKRLHALLTKAGMGAKEDKQGLVKAYSATSATSSKDLKSDEAERLIMFLDGCARLNQVQKVEDQAVINQRKKLLSLAHEMRWTLADNPAKVDVPRLMAWVQAQGVEREKLNDLTSAQLNKLVTQLQTVNTKRLTGR
jgi:uncharacterized metal-binding protein